eukprot:gene21734-28756_t
MPLVPPGMTLVPPGMRKSRKGSAASVLIRLTLPAVCCIMMLVGVEVEEDGEEVGRHRLASEAGGVAVCFIIRTYWGHATKDDNPLRKLLTELTKSEHKNWEALLVVMDGKPFSDLPAIIEDIGDSRISIHTELVGLEYRAKNPDGTWNGKYHDMLYNWVVVTNGDNEYDKDFLPRVASTPSHFGIISFDFYSRYQRPTAEPCLRFAKSLEAPLCKENKLSFCNTDLAAAVYNWPRFVKEERAFSKLPGYGLGLNDGYLAGLLVSEGWEVHHVKDRCLVSHSPNPQQCALRGGAWDDSMYDSFSSSGGQCLAGGIASAELLVSQAAAHGIDLELLEFEVSNDGQGWFRGDFGATHADLCAVIPRADLCAVNPLAGFGVTSEPLMLTCVL